MPDSDSCCRGSGSGRYKHDQQAPIRHRPAGAAACLSARLPQEAGSAKAQAAGTCGSAYPYADTARTRYSQSRCRKILRKSCYTGSLRHCRQRRLARKRSPLRRTAQPPAQHRKPRAPTTTAELHPPPNPANAAAEVAIGPDISSAEAARDRQSTTQLLDTTEKQLKRVDSNNLSSDQQAMLTQIQDLHQPVAQGHHRG